MAHPPTTTPGLPRRLLIWTAICSVSAAPSFFVGWSLHPEVHQVAAMVLGVAIFIVAYTLVTGMRPFRTVGSNPLLRRTFRIGYGTRLVISIIFPIGMQLDLLCGLLSTGVVAQLVQDPESFAGILTTTLVQGAVLNLLLLLYMSVVYGFQRLVMPRPIPAGHCAGCGYDLRGSPGVCPECGQPGLRRAA